MPPHHRTKTPVPKSAIHPRPAYKQGQGAIAGTSRSKPSQRARPGEGERGLENLAVDAQPLLGLGPCRSTLPVSGRYSNMVVRTTRGNKPELYSGSRRNTRFAPAKPLDLVVYFAATPEILEGHRSGDDPRSEEDSAQERTHLANQKKLSMLRNRR